MPFLTPDEEIAAVGYALHITNPQDYPDDTTPQEYPNDEHPDPRQKFVTLADGSQGVAVKRSDDDEDNLYEGHEDITVFNARLDHLDTQLHLLTNAVNQIGAQTTWIANRIQFAYDMASAMQDEMSKVGPMGLLGMLTGKKNSGKDKTDG